MHHHLSDTRDWMREQKKQMNVANATLTPEIIKTKQIVKKAVKTRRYLEPNLPSSN